MLFLDVHGRDIVGFSSGSLLRVLILVTLFWGGVGGSSSNLDQPRKWGLARYRWVWSEAKKGVCCTSCGEVRAERDSWTSHFPGREMTRVSRKIAPTVLFVASLSVCEESASVFQAPASVAGLPLSAFQGAGGVGGGLRRWGERFDGCRTRLQGHC